MIHFFRRIRQVLLSKSKFRKYALYAIGEIALVMFGILLALQFNNWNEQRKQNNKEYITLLDLHNEYSTNKFTFSSHLERKVTALLRMERLIDAIAHRETADSLLTNERGPSGSITYNPSQSVIQSVLETGMINVISNDSLRNLLTDWNDLLQDYIEDEKWHINFLHTELYKYETNHIPNHYFKSHPRDGYISPFHTPEEMGEYFKNAYSHPVYRNLLLRNYQYLDGTITEGHRVKNMMDKTISLLRHEIKRYDPNF